MSEEDVIRMSRPKTLRRLKLEGVHKLPRPSLQSISEGTSMSPMTDLAHNMSGTSLDSTPKRTKFPSALDWFGDGEDQCLSDLVCSTRSLVRATSAGAAVSEAADAKLMSPFSEKENAPFSSTTAAAVAASSPLKAAADGVCLLKHSSPKPRRSALAPLDVNSPIKAGFAKPAPPVTSTSSSSSSSSSCCLPSMRVPSTDDVDSQDSGCYPEDSKYFKYPEPLLHRRSLSDRNTVGSPASARRGGCSSGGSGAATKLEFSFSCEDEGIPMDDLFADEDADLAASNVPSAAVSRLFATPLSEKAIHQFSSSSHGDERCELAAESPAAAGAVKPHELSGDKHRPNLRRSWSMFENGTPIGRSQSASCHSPLESSPVARGLFVHDDHDTGSSPVAPLGLHLARIRTKQVDQRIIQPVGGPPSKSKRSESTASATGSAASAAAESPFPAQENKRRKDDSDERSMLTLCSESAVSTFNSCSLRAQSRGIQRCHSETEATIMRALQRSSEEEDLIGDFTLPFVLPLTRGKHQDLKSISPQTLVDLLEGRFQHLVEKFTIVDCRYPYEFEHGHVRDALNLWTKDMVWNRFMEGRQTVPNSGAVAAAADKKRDIIVFHCEFSSERGPALSRYLRNKDRDDNEDNYPALHWPEVYLLEGGYKAFFEKFQEWCDPCAYRPMNEPGHEEDLRRCRAKTKASHGHGKAGRPLSKSSFRRRI